MAKNVISEMAGAVVGSQFGPAGAALGVLVTHAINSYLGRPKDAEVSQDIIDSLPSNWVSHSVEDDPVISEY